MPIDMEMNKMKELIDEELGKVFEGKLGPQSKIFESMDYSLFTGGKRIRPILLLKSCEILGGDYKDCLPFALAMEMIHTYSLIHDDLPSMDDDEYRRGRPTNHMVYGEAMAILSGDGLLNLAFETMIEHSLENARTVEDYNRYIRAIDEMVRYSGVEGMIGGQVVDLLANEMHMDEEKLLFMYKAKTAGLIQASLVAGAILAGRNSEEVEKMRDFGLHLGLAYQIRDDILDKEEDEAIDKFTFLKYNNLQDSKDKVEELSEKAINILGELEGRNTNFLRDLTMILTKRNY